MKNRREKKKNRKIKDNFFSWVKKGKIFKTILQCIVVVVSSGNIIIKNYELN